MQIVFRMKIVFITASFFVWCSCFGQSYFSDNIQDSHPINNIDTIEFKSPYELKLEKELVLFGTGIVTNITGLIITNNVSPLTLQEIDELDINDINSIDRNAIKPYSESLNGDYLLYTSFLLPLTFLANENTRNDWQLLGAMWLEVLALQTGINLMIKGLVKRTRPYVYDPNTPIEKKQSVDARFSFYSGHTSTTAATSFFVARVFSDYLDNKLAKTLIWTGAIIYPALTGYARKNTGNHFRTDVIVGYLVGATIGYFIPELHLKNEAYNVSFYRNFYNDSFNFRFTYKL